MGSHLQLLFRNYPIDESKIQRSPCVDSFPEQGYFHRSLRTHNPGQPVGSAPIRTGANIAVSHRKVRIIGRDNEIATIHQGEAKASNSTSYARDDRLLHATNARHGIVNFTNETLKVDLSITFVMLECRMERVDVAARHEVSSGSPDNDGTHITVIFHATHCILQQFAQLVVEGIEDPRAI